MSKIFINTFTGSIGTKEDWDYFNEEGEEVNAVDLGEVVEVYKDNNGNWIESK